MITISNFIDLIMNSRVCSLHIITLTTITIILKQRISKLDILLLDHVIPLHRLIIMNKTSIRKILSTSTTYLNNEYV